jgi:hypothetical protein
MHVGPAATVGSPHAAPLPPPLQGINRATNAFLRWSLGSDAYQAWLVGLQEMPKVGGWMCQA